METALTPEEEFVKAVLEDQGAAVKPIPRSTERTPDFEVQLGDARYVIEVKTRTEDAERVLARSEALRRGAVAEDSEGLKRKNTISGIIAWGVEQLESYGSSEPFRVLWVHAGGPFAERYKYQFFNALYGATRLYDLDDKDFKVDGLYFRDSDFFRYRDALDAVVITMEVGQECELFTLVNNHSSKSKDFAASPLAQAFPVGLHDPLREEEMGNALIVRGDIDRRYEHAVMEHLRELTGRRLYNMDFTHASATVAVPRTT